MILPVFAQEKSEAEPEFPYKVTGEIYRSTAMMQVPLSAAEPREGVRAARRLLTSKFLELKIWETFDPAPSEERQKLFEDLRVQVLTKNIQGTDLFEVSVKSSDPQLSRDFATRLIET